MSEFLAYIFSVYGYIIFVCLIWLIWKCFVLFLQIQAAIKGKEYQGVFKEAWSVEMQNSSTQRMGQFPFPLRLLGIIPTNKFNEDVEKLISRREFFVRLFWIVFMIFVIVTPLFYILLRD